MSLDAADALGLARAHLAAAGVVHVRDARSAARALAFCNQLGTVWSETRVFVDARARRFVLSPAAVPFHTDSVRASLCAWYCVTPCPTAGASRYLDARAALDQLGAEERAIAARLCCADLMDGLAAADRPLVPVIEPRPDGRTRVFWLPPRLQVPTDPRERAVAARLIALWRGDDPATPVVEVALAARELVIVDNHRMLHGRGAVPVDSPRELYRMWIDTYGWPDAAARRVRVVAALAGA
ncbi:MAG: TauD/TfdA family dioxygenase [Deltaproteobacteria bacterium]|nr:TauD/TfdA family dioxygenase [Deltaproteobacteria bacterium]